MPVDEATLIQYGLGIQDAEERKAIQREIAASPDLQEQLASIQNALDQIAFAEQPVRPSHRLRDRVLQSTQDETRFDGFIGRFASLFDLGKQASISLLAKIESASDSDWESIFLPGVKIMKFAGGPRVALATCGIVQVKAGTLFPAHQHQADERILVLQGFARDDKARVITTGDIFEYSKGSSHSFRVIGDEDFIFAVVLYKKNKLLLVKTLLDYLFIKKGM